jgi:hypothetical protein
LQPIDFQTANAQPYHWISFFYADSGAADVP